MKKNEMWPQALKHSASVLEFMKAVDASGDEEPVSGNAELEGKQPSELLEIFRATAARNKTGNPTTEGRVAGSHLQSALEGIEGVDYAAAFASLLHTWLFKVLRKPIFN